MADLIETTFRLPFQWMAPDVVIAELKVPDGKMLIQAGLQGRELPGAQVLIVAALAERYVRPSRTDLFALVLAKETRTLLLTGDKALREAADLEGVAVHGVLWLLDQMVDSHQVLSGQKACQALERMIQAGRRLPEAEIKARFRRWK